MGPTCEVLVDADEISTLEGIDRVLTASADTIDKTRKGRFWDVWINGRPVHIAFGKNRVVELSAGLNSPEDYEILRQLAGDIIAAVGGVATNPEK